MLPKVVLQRKEIKPREPNVSLGKEQNIESKKYLNPLTNINERKNAIDELKV
jgi:hypothetical protein